MRFFAFASLYLLSGLALYGQQPKATPHPLPEGPLLIRAPEFARWTITTTLASDPQHRGNFPASSVVKTGNIIFEQTRDENGEVWSKWLVGGVSAVLAPGRTDWMLTAAGTGSFQNDYSRTDFPDFAWVSPATYFDTLKVGNRDCIVFKPGGGPAAQMETSAPATSPPGSGAVAPPAPPVAKPQGDVTAFVDLQTRLPVSYKDGEFLRIYQFQSPPTAKLIPPPELQAALDNRAKRIRGR